MFNTSLVSINPASKITCMIPMLLTWSSSGDCELSELAAGGEPVMELHDSIAELYCVPHG
jgi:hypothetical protein